MAYDSMSLKTLLFELVNCLINMLFVSAWYNDFDSFFGKIESDSFSNTRGWGSDDCYFSFHILISYFYKNCMISLKKQINVKSILI